MKNLPWILVAILAILLALTYIFQPEPPPPDTKVYDSLIRLSREGEAKALELSELRKADSLHSIESKRVYDLKVKKLESRLSDLKANPVIVRIREEIKEVDSLIIAYDSTIQVKNEAIDMLSSELYDCQKLAYTAEENFEMTLQAHKGANAELLDQVKGYQKEVRKQRRLKRLGIAAGIITTVGALLVQK